jgi:hypothetical protein
VDDVAAGADASGDISSLLRQAVAAEIERQRQEREAEAQADLPSDDG